MSQWITPFFLQVYSNCSCILSPLNSSTASAQSGYCDRGSVCYNFIPFLLLIIVLLLMVFITAIPSKVVILRFVLWICFRPTSAFITFLVRQSVFQSVSQSVSQSASQSVSQSVSQSISQPASQPASQSGNQSVSKSVSQPVSQLASQSGN